MRKYGPMPNVCAFCQTQESAAVGKWLVCADWVGRRSPPSSVCDSFVDAGLASSLGLWAPGSPAPFRCNVCCALGAALFREAVVEDYKSRCHPALVCKDVFWRVRGWRNCVVRRPPNWEARFNV